MSQCPKRYASNAYLHQTGKLNWFVLSLHNLLNIPFYILVTFFIYYAIDLFNICKWWGKEQDESSDSSKSNNWEECTSEIIRTGSNKVSTLCNIRHLSTIYNHLWSFNTWCESWAGYCGSRIDQKVCENYLLDSHYERLKIGILAKGVTSPVFYKVEAMHLCPQNIV